MTQFNLLPDIKLEYIKAQKLKRLVISVSVLVTAASVLLVGVLFSWTALQKAQINSLSADIQKQGSIISGQTNLNEILTIQNQIDTLTKLHEQEPAAANLSSYLNQIIPVNANLNNLSIDFTQNSLVLTGSANSLATVNQLIDSLKFATYTVNGSSTVKNAFSNVVLSSFGVSTQSTTFTINLNFDPTLFDNTHTVTLTVPSKVTTRSQLDQPTVLFKPSASTNGG